MNRFHLLVVVASFAALASCTTNQSALLPPLPEVEAHVISGGAPIRMQPVALESASTAASSAAPLEPVRSVASIPSEASLEKEFQAVISSEDVDKETRQYIDRVARIFYRTQALLNDYDAKLDDYAKQTNVADGALQTDDTYARLISAWSLREETTAKITYFYKRANEIAHARMNDSKVSKDLQNRALLMNRAIRNTVVSSANSTNRLAKQNLLKELIEVQKSGAFSNQILNGARETSDFYERNKLQLARETENARKDEEINQEIEARAPEIKAALAEQYEKRTPQSVGAIAPGLGRSGMMNGFEFKTGRWALTFDDGPHSTYTPQALANLKANDMKATFFWIAQNVSKMPSIVKQAQAAGHTLANHSYTHANLPKLGPGGLRHEIIESTTVDVQNGYRPRFFRCPYGACGSQTSAVRQKIADLGLVSVTWNVDSLDWQDKNPQSVYERVKKQMAVQKRGIILFHDIHPQSIAASKMLMADFAAGQKKGIYRTVTIDQAFDELNTAEGMK